MMEKAPKYRATFKPLPRSVGLLGGDMAPHSSADVTNPRELYAMLSQSRGHQGLSVRLHNSQTGTRLPPLDSSLEAQFRSLVRHPQHSSYPDLDTWRSENDAYLQPHHHHHHHPHHHPDSLRRSSSLQDLHSMGLSVEDMVGGDDGVTHVKKLKPILKGIKTKNVGEKVAGTGVKFGEKEVHLIPRDSPLPPIEGRGKDSSGRGGALSGVVGSCAKASDKDKAGWALSGGGSSSSSPRHYRRHGGAELSSEMFPRGQPVEVRKPATPTYNDYPEVYWELRSLTVQDPSNLKEDMIDRDRYRLKQISSLHLKAMNRELAAGKLDSYRKWQQQLMTVSPPAGGAGSKQESVPGSVTPSGIPGPTPSARQPGNQQKMLMASSVQTDALALAATSISPNANPAIKRRVDNGRSVMPDHRHVSNGDITADELRRRRRIDATARGESGAAEAAESRPVRAAVVNLCIDPDHSSNSSTSEVYTGIRRIMFGAQPPSVKSKTQASVVHDQGQQGQGSVTGPPDSVSVASVNATFGSSYSHHGPTRVLSAPTDSSAVALHDGSLAARDEGGDTATMTTNTDTSSVGSKKILKKFTKLQVFSENHTPAREGENAATPSSSSARPWKAERLREKGQYLPQSRPPSYKLDLRHYPIRHYNHHNSVARFGGDDMTAIAEVGGDWGFQPLLFHDKGGDAVPLLGYAAAASPSQSEAPSVTFQFRDGEVIVSRQSKRPDVS